MNELTLNSITQTSAAGDNHPAMPTEDETVCLTTGENTHAADANTSSIDTLASAAKHYHSQLPDHARETLHQFGLTDETIAHHMIGYADGTLGAWALKADPGYDLLRRLVGVGLVKMDAHGVPHDCLAGRIAVPETDGVSVVRIVGLAVDGSEPQCIFAPDSESRPLGIGTLREGAVAVVPTPLDVLALGQMGIPAVALCGHYCPQNLAELFPRNGKVFICMGADAAGRGATEKLVAQFPQSARVVEVPDGLSPGQFVCKNGGDAFRKMMNEAPDGLTYLVRRIPQSTPHTDIMAELRPVLPIMAGMDGPTLEAHLRETIRAYFGTDGPWTKALREEVKKHRQDGEAPKDAQAGKIEVTATGHGIVDLVIDDSQQILFLVLNEDGEPAAVPMIVDHGVMCVPPRKDQIPFTLPRASEVLRYWRGAKDLGFQADAVLLGEIDAFLRSVVEMPCDDLYQLVSLWAMLSHLAEKFEFSPILALLGEPERGKTRLGKALINISRRGIMTETLHPGYMPRFSQGFGGSLFLDVVDASRTALSRGSRDLINARFSRDTKVMRVTRPGKTPFDAVEYFSSYGATVIASNVPLDEIITTRSLVITMGVASRRFETEVTAETCRPLREKLVAFRARHEHTELPACSKPVDGRLGDLLRPLLSILRLVGGDGQDVFDRNVKHFTRGRDEEKSHSLGARILKAVATCQRKNERVLVADIANQVFADKTIDKCRTVSSVIRAMGFSTKPSNRGTVMLWDDERLAGLAGQYGIGDGGPAAGSPPPGQVGGGDDGEDGEDAAGNIKREPAQVTYQGEAA